MQRKAESGGMFDQENSPDTAPPVLKFTFLDGDATLSETKPASVPDWIGLHLDFDGRPATLHVDAAMLGELLTAAGYADVPQRWKAETKSMALAHLGRPLVDKLGAALGGQVSLRTTTEAPEGNDALYFLVQSQHFGAGTLRLTADAETREKIQSSFQDALPRPQTADAPDKPTALRLVSPTYEIDMASFKELVIGDVILLDPDGDFLSTCRVRLEDGREAAAQREEDGYVMASAFEEPKQHGEDEDPLTGDALQFYIELEKQQMPSEDIDALDEGAELPFKTGDAAWVRVLTRNLLIGTGQLVSIEGRTHVRLMRVG